MPIYTWLDKKSEQAIDVIRSIDKIDTPPTESELEHVNFKVQNPDWKRIIKKTGWQRGNGWNYSKGNV